MVVLAVESMVYILVFKEGAFMGGMDLGGGGGFSPEFGLSSFRKQRETVVHGTIPFNFSTTITESKPDTDDVSGRVTMNVDIELVTDGDKSYSFSTRESLNADKSVIRSLSDANYPCDAVVLTPKIINGLVEEETTNLEDLTNAREREICRSKLSIARIGGAAGFFTGSAMTGTVALAAEGHYTWASITGIWSLMGGFVIATGVKSRDENVEFNKSREVNKKIEDAVERKTILKFIQSASRRQQIKNV